MAKIERIRETVEGLPDSPYLKSWRSVVILFLTCFEWSGAKRLKRKG